MTITRTFVRIAYLLKESEGSVAMFVHLHALWFPPASRNALKLTFRSCNTETLHPNQFGVLLNLMPSFDSCTPMWIFPIYFVKHFVNFQKYFPHILSNILSIFKNSDMLSNNLENFAVLRVTKNCKRIYGHVADTFTKCINRYLLNLLHKYQSKLWNTKRHKN